MLPPGSVLGTLEQYSFSDEAAQAVCDTAHDAQTRYHARVEDIWSAVMHGDDYGLVPFENSSAGVVWPHLDRLCKEQLSIVGEVRLQVKMCVGGLHPEALRSAERAYSHPKGHEQCAEFYRLHPHITERIDVPATPDGPRRVRDAGDPTAIALASRRAIKSMGLTLLAEDVADLKGDGNVTQFFVVHRNGASRLPDPERVFHAALLTPRNSRGVLHTILSMLTNARMDLLSLHSRSIGQKEYAFFVEMQREGSPEELDLLSRQLEIAPHIQHVKWLGSWDHRLSV